MILSRVLRVSVATVVLSAILSPAFAAQNPAALLNTIFRDHAVVQRDAPIHIWGTGAPGETITVELAGTVAEADVDDSGNWTAQLPAMAAGGPYTLDVRSTGGAVQTVTDVVIGDVFLCSGQSNMALPVSRTLNAPTEIRNAANDRIRMLEIGRASSAAPLETLPKSVVWETATPETVPDWSATCYYFARALQWTVGVPIGLINSSWGGSGIRAWMSRDALSAVGGYEKPLSLLRLYADDPRAAQLTFGDTWETWWHAETGDAVGTEPWQPRVGAQWPLAPEGLGSWKEWGRSELRDFNGMMWFRTTVELTAAQAKRGAVLSLGVIDEVDQTWINGHVVGNTFGWGTERTYPIPADLLQEGKNVVVVNVLNTYGAGGMMGDPALRALIIEGGDRIPLHAWRYKNVSETIGMPPRTPWESVGGLSTIYNAMVAPLRDYSLKAVVWYQGAADTDEAGEYLDLLRAHMAYWRRQFGTDLPILIVQLANYGTPPTAPTESGWAEVREAQRLATNGEPHTGLVVTIDLGSAYDIHPANKQEVGRRLARAARHVMYGEAVTPSGPVPAGVARRSGTVVVTFEDVVDSLVAYGNPAPIGFELCGTEPGSCRYAEARIDGRRVLLRAEPGRKAARVRYCWADSPICTLYDVSGLPAGPFELHIPE